MLVADATGASAPDEPAPQDPWPQPSAQKPGCGFPLVKLLGVLDLVGGMIVQLSLTSMGVQEMSQDAGHTRVHPRRVSEFPSPLSTRSDPPCQNGRKVGSLPL